MTPKIVEIYDHNYRDVAKTLRDIADQIERGDFGDVGTAGLVLLGDTMEVFGMGPDSEAPSIALLFNAAIMRLAAPVEEFGK